MVQDWEDLFMKHLAKYANFFNWAGALLAMASCALNSLNVSCSKYSWIGYVLSSIFLMLYFICVKNRAQTVMVAWFFFFNSLGVIKWIVMAGPHSG